MKAATSLPIIVPLVDQFLQILTTINLYEIAQNSKVLEIDFNYCRLNLDMPMNEMTLFKSALSWHSPIFLSMLANAGNFAPSQFQEILRNIILERSIIVVSSGDSRLAKNDFI